MSLLFIVQRRHFTILSTSCSGSELNHHYSLFCMTVLAAKSTRNIVWAAAESTHAVLNLLNFTSNDFHYHSQSSSFRSPIVSSAQWCSVSLNLSPLLMLLMLFSNAPHSNLQSTFHIFHPVVLSLVVVVFFFSPRPRLLSSVPLNLLHNYFPSLLEYIYICVAVILRTERTRDSKWQ